MVFDLSTLPLDWPLAVRRFERDTQDDFFPDPLHNRDVLQFARKDISEVVDLSNYEPEPTESWDVPKPNLTFRHIIHLSPIDRIVYQALVDYVAAKADARLNPACRAFRLRGVNTDEMFHKRVLAHKEINGEVRAVLKAKPDARLVTIDIAQYFENINLERLFSAIVEALGHVCDDGMLAVVTTLIDCLKVWCPYEGRGIPQNTNPSSHLGNLFLCTLDHEIAARGWRYWRYMDDMKIVASDEGEARRAMKAVTDGLRSLQLSVNGEKTAILRPGSPRYVDFMTSDVDEIDTIESAVARSDPAELEATATRLYEIANGLLTEGRAGERMFRFALNRLTSLRRTPSLTLVEPDGFADRLIALLVAQPADTPKIRDYFAARPGGAGARSLAMLLVNEPACVYSWQNYHLWIQAALDEVDDPELVAKARVHLVDGATSDAEMAGAAVYLGAVGEAIDVTLVEDRLRSRRHPLSVNRALLLALQRLEGDKRSAIMEELAAEAGSLGVLARFLGRLSTPRYVARQRRVTLRRLIDAMPDDFS